MSGALRTVAHKTTEELDKLYRCIYLKCRSHDKAVIDSYDKFVVQAAKHLDIPHVGTEHPFREIKRRTLLASRHVHKKYRVQYEFRTYMSVLEFKNLTGSTADTFLEYVERNLPEGMHLTVTKHELGVLPFTK